jgi:hypothetical protein
MKKRKPNIYLPYQDAIKPNISAKSARKREMLGKLAKPLSHDPMEAYANYYGSADLTGTEEGFLNDSLV